MTGEASPFADHGDDRYFTQAGYRAILTAARAGGYRLLSFRDFAPAGAAAAEDDDAGPVLLLRHDLDHDLWSAVTLAGIEAEEAATATYFVQTCCPFYNLLAPAGRAAIRAITEAGHEIGLHYEAARYAGPGGDAALAADIRLLQDLSGQPVTAAAQHIPIDGGQVDLSARIANDAYAPRFTTGRVSYISDSLMHWRQATPHDLIAAGRAFQLLTHPECWTADHRSMLDCMGALREARIAETRHLFAETLDHYATLLRERAERDRRFRADRWGESGQ
ncbi:MAG: hypothetical protein R3F55_02905 [Alphaproteobacteria bacterium]